MNTTDKNIEIARFLGYKEQKDPTESYFGNFFKPNYGWVNLKELDFHSNWNTLIEATRECLVGEANYEEQDYYTYIEPIYDGLTNQDISTLFNAVYDIINWKNNLNKVK